MSEQEETRTAYQILKTDVEAASVYAAGIVVVCSECTPGGAVVSPEALIIRPGLDYVRVDYACENGHLNEGIELSELARVALTTLYNSGKINATKQFVTEEVDERYL